METKFMGRGYSPLPCGEGIPLPTPTYGFDHIPPLTISGSATEWRCQNLERSAKIAVSAHVQWKYGQQIAQSVVILPKFANKMGIKISIEI